EKLTGKRAHVEHRPRHAADVAATWADIAKAGRLLDWRPATRFRDGVERLVEWYDQQRDWARDVPTE
ncbi:MAG: nucleotide sugar epimerase, partial [Gemmatimonadetes bacterium]|nr:nucleotide sugar epimerase [Gemmatimonadota bacterium]